MVASTSRPGRVVLVAAVATLTIFGALIAFITLQLRSRLRHEVLQREAEAIHAVAQMQIRNAGERLPGLGAALEEDLLFIAVLESSKLRGVFAVQLFDAAGVLRDSLQPGGARGAPQRWWPLPLGSPQVRFRPEASLEAALGYEPEGGAEPTRLPLLEIVVPLESDAVFTRRLGVAHYWIDGEPLAAEFSRLDRALAFQAGVAFAGGGVLITLVLAAAFSRLARANRRLVEQSADLARANEELDFAAKTGALGAISAHLIHGLNNPLAGIEGFVAEGATGTADPIRGQAWRSAMETTGRLRALVNEVATVLRDEALGTADYRVPLVEVIDAARARAAGPADQAGVALGAEVEPDVYVTARNASLAGLVLANLLANAIEATPRGGRVSIDARGRGELVEFRVADTGGGLPAGVKGTLFRPVPSAKPGGGGVGLAISHRLAKHARGELELVRSDAAGTVFRLSVPAFVES